MALVSAGLDSVAIAGNLIIDIACVTVLATANLAVFGLEKFASLVFGRASTDTFDFEPHVRRTCIEPVYTQCQRPTGRNIGEIDEAQTLAKSTFPLSFFRMLVSKTVSRGPQLKLHLSARAKRG